MSDDKSAASSRPVTAPSSTTSTSSDSGSVVLNYGKVSMLKPKSAPIGNSHPAPAPGTSRIGRPCSNSAKKAAVPPVETKPVQQEIPRMRRPSDSRSHLEDVSEENEYELERDNAYRSARSSRSPENKRYDRKSSIASTGSNAYYEITGEDKYDEKEVLTENTESFKIADRVWVGGRKPGNIIFIGEAHFAPGIWAGIALDEPVGRNDGMVDGKRYFQCEPKKGVFSRLSRLSSYPIGGSGDDNSMSQSFMSTSSPLRSGTVSPTHSVQSSVLRTPGKAGGLRIGDRVIVASPNGSRRGVLRYVGEIYVEKVESRDKKQIYAGIELDDPTGKNNGTLNGISYFVCEANHGLFVPIEKVTLSPMANKPRLSRANSRESLMSTNTIGSMASTATSRYRMSAQKSPPKVASTPKIQSSLQEVLREKETQLSQLMKELEIERDYSANQSILNKKNVDETEKHIGRWEELIKRRSLKVADLRREFQGWHGNHERHCILHDLSDKVVQLSGKLDEERRRVEDLQFTIEELKCSNADLKELQEGEKSENADASSNTETASTLSLTSTKEFQELQEELLLQKEKTKSSENLRKSLENQIQSLNEKLLANENELQQQQKNDTVLESQLSAENSKLRLQIDDLQKLIENNMEHTKSLTVKHVENEKAFQSKLELVEKDASDSKAQLLSMQKLIEEKNALLAALQSSQEEKESSSAKIMNVLSEKDGEIEALKSLNATNEDELAQTRFTLQELQSKIEQLSETAASEASKLSEKENIIAKLQSDFDAHTLKIDQLNEVLSVSNNSNSSNVVIIDNLKTELENLKQQFTLNGEKNTEVFEAKDQELQNLKAEQDNLLKMKQQLEQSLKEAESNVLEKDKQAEELEMLNKALQGEVKELNVNSTQLKHEISSLKSNFSSKDEITMQLNAENEKLTGHITELETQILELTKSRAEVEAAKDELNKKSEEMKQAQHTELQSLDESKKAVEQKLAESNEESAKLKTHISELEATKVQLTAKLDEEINEKNQCIAKLNNEIKFKDVEIESAKLKQEEIEAKFNVSELNYLEIRDAMSKSKIENGDLQRQIVSFEERLVQSADQKKELEVQLSNLRKTSFNSNSEVTNLSEALKAKQKALDDVQESSSKMKLELERRLQESTQVIENLNTRVAQLQTDLDKVSTQKICRENEMSIELVKITEAAEAEKEKLMKEIAATKANLTGEMDTISTTLNKQLEQLKVENSELLQKSEKDLKSWHEELESIKSKAQQEKDDLSEKVNQLTTSEDSLKSELEKVRESEKNLLGSLNKLNETSESGYKELTQQISDKNSLIENLEKDLSQVKINAELEMQKRQKLEATLTKNIEDIATLTTMQTELIKSNESIQLEKNALAEKAKELEQKLAEMTNKFKETEDDQVDLVMQTERLKATKYELENVVEKLNAEKKEMTETLSKIQKEYADYQQTTKTAHENYDLQIKTSTTEIQQRDERLKETTVNLTSTISATEELKKDLKQKDDIIAEMKTELTRLNQSLNDVQSQHSQSSTNSDKAIAELREKIVQNANEIREKTDAIEQIQKCLKEKSDAVETMSSENTTLMHKVGNIQSELSEKEIEVKKAQNKIIELTTEKDVMLKRIDEILSNKKTEESHSNEAFLSLTAQLHSLEATKKAEIDSLQAALEEVQLKIPKLCEEVEQQFNKLSISQKREQELSQQQKEVQKREAELKALNSDFERQIMLLKHQLQAKDNEILNMKQNPVQQYLDGGEDDSGAKICFLNSIIAEMQKKNENLISKLQLLESGPGDTINMDFMSKRKPAPRMYCDICEEFDSHETEDCPIQCSETPSPPRSLEKDDKKRVLPPKRKYCENCEIFDHDTEECTLDDTF